jgi:hypothetical protein
MKEKKGGSVPINPVISMSCFVVEGFVGKKKHVKELCDSLVLVRAKNERLGERRRAQLSRKNA